jgi:hypothetical protein
MYNTYRIYFTNTKEGFALSSSKRISTKSHNQQQKVRTPNQLVVCTEATITRSLCVCVCTINKKKKCGVCAINNNKWCMHN